MKDYIEERVLELARYIIDTNSTVRAAARKFRVSKSTVHKDVTERLLEINPGLAADVKAVLENNKAERHLRGGMATRENTSTRKKNNFKSSKTKSTITEIPASKSCFYFKAKLSSALYNTIYHLSAKDKYCRPS